MFKKLNESLERHIAGPHALLHEVFTFMYIYIYIYILIIPNYAATKNFVA